MARTPKAQALGSALRRAREDNGIKLRELAARIDHDPGVVSRWENGDRIPKPENVARILTTIGVNGTRYEEIIALAYNTDAPLWIASGLPEQRQQLAALVDAERKATKITNVAPLLVPGLLQTNRYIHAVMSGGGVPVADIETRMAIRIARRDVLTRSQPVTLVAFVGEAVLHQVIGNRDTVREQLTHLIHMARRPNIDMRLIPYDSEWHPALEGAFDLIESDRSVPVVHLENRRSGFFLHEEADVRAYQQAVGMVRRVALSPELSISRIHHAVKRMESRK
jgi:transcriptional regulator with XRE-family HTH domain